MKKVIYHSIIGFIIILLQTTFFFRFKFMGVGFDAPFVYIICLSTYLDTVSLVFVSLITGIISDSMFPGIFGLNCLTYLILSYISALLSNRLYRKTAASQAFFVFSFTIVKNLLFYFFFYVSSLKYPFVGKFLKITSIEAVLNLIIGVLIFDIIKRFRLRKEKKSMLR